MFAFVKTNRKKVEENAETINVIESKEETNENVVVEESENN